MAKNTKDAIATFFQGDPKVKNTKNKRQKSEKLIV